MESACPYLHLLYMFKNYFKQSVQGNASEKENKVFQFPILKKAASGFLIFFIFSFLYFLFVVVVNVIRNGAVLTKNS